ncbi:hypothetical protein PROFUN_09722 [Planoprotostelium fungivorum]|uniref:Uncharacterized protein n=1 Tax=Planoprotostelium fungivorum TaxID=1890364 RepID=A0A2P6NEX8_9EUKA|nr:hypothetical protein PROFUN_09722 [Planoprotostelium fungivorum]
MTIQMLNMISIRLATVLRPPPGMKIQHLSKGIREYLSRNPADFKDYVDEISAETKYLSTISRLMQGTESGEEFCRLQRTQQILQMKMIQNTKIRGKKCELNEESDNLRGLFEKELASYNIKKQCMKMNNKRYEERLQDLIEEKEKEHKAEVQLEETQKELENKIEFIRKQMVEIRAFNKRLDQMDQTEKHHHCTSEKAGR